MKWWSWLIPVVIAAALYGPSLKGGLVWDDEIVQSKQMVAFHSVGDVFFPPTGIRQWSKTYYRPVITLSYLLDQKLFGRNATTGPHAAVVLYHVITTFFVWMLARQVLCRLPRCEWGAVVAGVLFAVHPIHTESVCWITGRSDTVAAMFFVPSIVVALHYRNRGSWSAFLVAPILYFLAILSKEVAFSGLLIAPWLFLLVPVGNGKPKRKRTSAKARRSGKKNKKKRSGRRPNRSGTLVGHILAGLPLLGLYVLATVGYFVLRHKADINYGRPMTVEPVELSHRFLGALAYYAAKVFVPSPQSCFVTDLPGAGYAIGAGVVGVILLVFSIWLFRRGATTFLVAFGWFFFALAPSLIIAIRQISETPVAERYLYLPSVGVCLVFGAVLCHGLVRLQWRVPATVAIFLIGSAYSYGTFVRVKVWQSDLALWGDATQKNPGEALPWHALGRAHSKKGRYESAIRCYQTALRVKSDAEARSLAHNSMGTCFYRVGKLDDAEQEFRAAIKERKRYDTPYYNLGVLLLGREQALRSRSGKPNAALLERARGLFVDALKINPHYVKAFSNKAKCESLIAEIQLRAGQRERALDMFQAARVSYGAVVKLDPNSGFAKSARTRIAELDKTILRLSR